MLCALWEILRLCRATLSVFEAGFLRFLESDSAEKPYECFDGAGLIPRSIHHFES
jgi:hypothetical protein